MNVTVTERLRVQGLDLVIGKTQKEPHVVRFEWPDGDTPWTASIEDACLYTSMAPMRVTARQVYAAMRKRKKVNRGD